jgi:hypothetical protein
MFRQMWFTRLGLRGSGDRQLGRVRHAMLSLLQTHGGHAIQRISQRVRFADDIESLWYLRQDLLLALSALDGEAAARRKLRQINTLFKGCLPQTMGPRVHQRFSA